MQTEIGANIGNDGTIIVSDRVTRTGVFPIGIETEEIVQTAKRMETSAKSRRLKLIQNNRSLIIGVDRLDYSKGLVERFRAFERLFDIFPEERNRVTLMQIAPPTRTNVGSYRQIRRDLESAASEINGRLADFDWVPIRYINRSYSQSDMTGFYRHAEIGLVTPLRDGMNLVAKEYVAAQNPENPGVLVLSRFAGAARELAGALIVNPFDIDEVAEAIRVALHMPQDERIRRWESMIDRLHRQDVHAWRRQFLEALDAA
jgi:trehalose 6-phosphate synthase